MAYRETYEEHEKRVDRINRSGPQVCRYFQRGQCYKENCEFSHTLHGSTISKTPCRNYQVSLNNKSKSLPDFNIVKAIYMTVNFTTTFSYSGRKLSIRREM